MRKGSITRTSSGDDGTFSVMEIIDKADPAKVVLKLSAGELPQRGNQHDVSCLAPMKGEPPITYVYRWTWSEDHRKFNYRCIGVLNADGTIGPIPGNRTAAEIHSANVAGDIFKNLAAQLKGCTMPGLDIAVFPKGSPFRSFTAASPNTLVEMKLSQDQTGVTGSGIALGQLERELAGEDLALTVSWT